MDEIGDLELDGRRLAELRAHFLGERSSYGGDYWQTSADLELYDRTFGRRIAWKWRAVLTELARRGFALPGGTWVDWGAGTAVASREARAYAAPERCVLVDRSRVALDFARAELERLGLASIEARASAGGLAPDLLLVSHVLSELEPPALDELLDLARRARHVLWVESGDRATSRALGEVRERLRESSDIVAPCTHRERCGALAGPDDWCHFFAQPPPEVFTDGGWARFGRRMGIDLRALPYSFLATAPRGSVDARAGEQRLIGRARTTKGRLTVSVCDASGLASVALKQRTDRALFKRLAAGDVARTHELRIESGEIQGEHV